MKLDHKAILMGLFVAIIVTMQQIAVIIVELFLKPYLTDPYPQLIGTIASLLVLMYYINRILKSYKLKKRRTKRN